MWAILKDEELEKQASCGRGKSKHYGRKRKRKSRNSL